MSATQDSAARDELLAGIRETVAGVTARFDRAYFMRQARADGSIDELWQDLADKGLLGVGVPEELGGAGGGLSGMATVMERMSAVGVPPILFALTTFSLTLVLVIRAAPCATFFTRSMSGRMPGRSRARTA